ncbi:hypothetical protein JMN32_13175 [Fulvivirga sp. 29W222]|uniref:SH3 domain-containing protein n=1 Tax=Fulvivirga marina TaxID=2494733 RepID=A0A937FYE4_9BACT|nr:hypothetical protein [Fulvivirga marina]MBL6447268.1 hypothetical protein [Fulvivirga marina]
MMLRIFCTLLVVTCSVTVKAQNQVDNMLAQADSLFQIKKYTESFDIYQRLLEKEHQASPAMLLKMAFIKEGLGDYTNALYYINLYYLRTADKKALDKMEELAKAKNLEGYSLSDFDFFKSTFFKFYNAIVITLFILALLFMGIMIYRKKKHNQKPVVSGIFTIIMLALLFYTLNFGKDYQKVIITQSNTYIMDGPSAGAEVIAIVGKGHRLPVKGQKDIWTQTEWNGQTVFIKENKLKKISIL